MHFSLVCPVTAAILAVVSPPPVNAQGTLPDGTYHLENLAFDTLSPKRLLDLRERLSTPGAPIITFMDNSGDNQRWNVVESGPGYNIMAVAPPSNVFVASLGVGSALTGTPDDKTTFLFNKLTSTPNVYQILVSSDSETFAVQSTTDGGQVTLGLLNATDPHQKWRLCPPTSTVSSVLPLVK